MTTDPKLCSDCGCELDEDQEHYCDDCLDADDWADEEEDEEESEDDD